MKRILIIAYSSLNLGDDLFIKMLCDKYPEIQFYIMTTKKNEKPFLDIHNLETFYETPKIDGIFNYLKIPYNYNLNKSFSHAKMMDAVIQIGGSIFIENTNWYSKYKVLDSIVNLKIPYFIIGSNFGPFITENYYKSYTSLFEKVDDICFRDTYSYNLFSNIPHVRQAPDVIFGLEHETIKYIDENYYVFSIIDLEHRPDLNQYKLEYENLMAKVIDGLLEMNKRIILMSFCTVEGDLNAIQRVIKQVKRNNKTDFLKVYDYQGNITESLEILKNAKAIIATRFHSLILALVFKKKHFTFIYSEKTRNLLKDISYKQDSVSIENLKNINYKTIINQLLNGKVENIDNIIIKSREQFKSIDFLVENDN